MVEGFVGLPGAGKTYYLTKLGLKGLKKNREVFANYKLKGAKYYTDLKEVIDIKKGIILVDEINLICPSRWWDRFPPKLAYWWSQTRKNELDVYWTAQHQDRVDKIVKEITNWIWEIRKLPFNFRLAKCFLPEQINKTRRENFGSIFFYISKNIYKNFNTYERIEVADSVNNFSNYGNYKKKYNRPYIPREIFLKNFVAKPKVFQERMKEMDKKYGAIDKEQISMLE
jgi:hypothetical protein